MDMLMGLVIGMFVVTGAYVGYHASQEPADEYAGGHDVATDLEILSQNFEPMLAHQKLIVSEKYHH